MEKRKRDSLDNDGPSPKRFKNRPTICKSEEEAYELLRSKKTFVFSPNVISFTLPHDCGTLEHLKRLNRALQDEGNRLQQFNIIHGSELMTPERVGLVLQSLVHCSALKSLTISDVLINFSDLAPLLRKNTLRSLAVKSSSLVFGPAGKISNILNDFLACSNLRTLDLSNNSLRIMEGVEKIITQHKSLRSVNLAGTTLSAEAMASIATFVQSSKTLTSLNLSKASLDDKDLFKLAKSLETNKTLTSLNISQNECKKYECDNFDFGGGLCSNVECGKAILQMLKSNNTITALKMRHIPLGDHDAEILKVLQGSNVIKNLSLEIKTQAGINQLGLALQSLTGLTELELDVLRGLNYKEFANGVAKNVTLKHIDVEYLRPERTNLVWDSNDEWKPELKKAFESNRTLLTVHLPYQLHNVAERITRRNKEIVMFDRSLVKQFVDLKDWEGMWNFYQKHATKDLLFEDMIDKNHYNMDAYEMALSNFLKKSASHNQELASTLKNMETDLKNQEKAISNAQSKIEEAKRMIVESEAQMKAAITARDNITKSLADIELNVRVTTCSHDKAEAEYKNVQEETKVLATLFKRPVETWSLDEVIMFLRDLQLHKYIEKFTENEIKGDVLVNLTTLDFHQLGMGFKEIKLLMSALFELKHFKSLCDIPDGMLYWKNEQVIHWLQENQFNHLKTKFTTCKITGEDLIVLDNYDLTHWLKIAVIADKTALEAAIKKLRAEFEAPANNGAQKKKVPKQFICPITHEIMKDPVSTIDGHTYERTAIELWLKKKSTSPVTKETLASKQLIPNHQLKSLIAEFQGAA